MNFDKALKAAMPAANEAPGLENRIRNKIDRDRRRRAHSRRWMLSAAAGLAVVAAIIAFPMVSAQAALGRIAGALDGAPHVVVLRYSVDDRGERHPAGVIAFDAGKWRVQQGDQDVTIFYDGHRYQYEAFTNSYLVEEADGPFAKNTGDLRFSSLIEHMNSDMGNLQVDTTTLQGKTVRRAIANNPFFPERTILLADMENDLPIVAFSESREGGHWRRGLEMEFRYDKKVDPGLFQLEPGRPVQTKEAWKKAMVERATSTKLASLPIRNGELIVRSLDVAEDGTVFVSYQSGAGSSWTGFAFDVADGKGGRYIPVEVHALSDSPWDQIPRKKGGSLEFEVFVPSVPAGPGPRNLTLTTRRDAENRIIRQIRMQTTGPDGEIELKWTPNHQGNDPRDPTPVVVLNWKFEKPTCAEAPAFMRTVDFGGWHDEWTSRLSKSQARAQFFLEQHDRERAAYWLRQQLYFMQKIESMGGGPYSRSQVESDLRHVGG